MIRCTSPGVTVCRNTKSEALIGAGPDSFAGALVGLGLRLGRWPVRDARPGSIDAGDELLVRLKPSERRVTEPANPRLGGIRGAFSSAAAACARRMRSSTLCARACSSAKDRSYDVTVSCAILRTSAASAAAAAAAVAVVSPRAVVRVALPSKPRVPPYDACVLFGAWPAAVRLPTPAPAASALAARTRRTDASSPRVSRAAAASSAFAAAAQRSAARAACTRVSTASRPKVFRSALVTAAALRLRSPPPPPR
mmetsp:Transcript_33118/g.102260  ORF Transcript_33118/g.102260 Transcript_33118/m.102260 type:complete len:253 (+) Transcript_33118:118-876(+)